MQIFACIQFSDIKDVRRSLFVARRKYNEQPTTNHHRSFKFSGDFVDRVTPVPIPNTAVKPVGADDTAAFSCGKVGSRRDYLRKSAQR